MPYFTYDTSVFISRRIPAFDSMPPDFLLSTVVFMELMAGAPDSSFRKLYEQAFQRYKKDELLIVPNEDDWLLTCAFQRRALTENWADSKRFSATAIHGSLRRRISLRASGAQRHSDDAN